jgi:hypothetical protein
MYYKGHGEVKVDIMLLLIANNCWTRSFAQGYWLFYFSSVFDSDEERKPLQEKDFSSEYVCCLIYPCPYWGESVFWQSVNILCRTNCWIKHGEAHDISPCLVFALRVYYLMRRTHNALWWVIMNSFDSTISYFGCVSCFLAKSARFVLPGGMYTFRYFRDCVVSERLEWLGCWR